MAFAADDWEVVKAYYERGFSLAEIVKQPDVIIKDKSLIQRTSRKKGWLQNGEKSTLVHKEIQAKQLSKEIKQEKSTIIKSTVELEVHNSIVNNSLAQIEFFNNASITNSKALMRSIKFDENNEPLPFDDVNQHLTIQKTLKEAAQTVGVFKYPNSQIVNNNSAQAAVVDKSINVTFE